MYRTACLVVLALPTVALGSAEDLTTISLMRPAPELPKMNPALRAVMSGALDVASLGFGSKIKAAIQQRLEEQFESSPEIRQLYPAQSDRRQVVRKIIADIDRRYPDAPKWPHSEVTWTNEKLNDVIRLVGRGVVNAVVDRAFTNFEIKDQKRHAAWSSKILGPFDACIRSAKTVLESQVCWESTQAGRGPNVALGLSHELLRGSVLSSVADVKFKEGVHATGDRHFRRCMEHGGKAQDCVLGAIQGGVVSVSRLKLEEKLAPAIGKAKYQALIEGDRVWPPYEACVRTAQDSLTIQSCIDRLVANAGTAAVNDIVLAHPRVVEALPKEIERKAFVAELKSEAVFKACVEEQLAQGKRVDGMLDVGPCELTVENRVTRAVLGKMFRASVQEKLGRGDSHENTIVASGMGELDRCWSDRIDEADRTRCLRGAILRVGEGVASRTLELRIPSGLRAEKPRLQPELEQGFSKCLREKAPQDILDAAKRDAAITFCSGALRKQTALPAAEYQLGEAFRARLSKQMLETLLKTRVRTDFAACLGDAPTDQTLGKCAVALTKRASTFAAKSIIPETLHGYFAEQGIVLSKDRQKEFEKFLSDNLSQLNSCFDRELTVEQFDDMGGVAEGCFKKNIRPIANYLAQLQFDLQTGPLYMKRQAKWLELRKSLMAEIDFCAAQGLEQAKEIKDYIEHVQGCGNRLALHASELVGK
ncbi:MAG: hypothetical protein NDJ90_02255, partial [Oligoflexia bacterium]|nr:hypothetical protein [Oligoflexia bacterium]